MEYLNVWAGNTFRLRLIIGFADIKVVFVAYLDETSCSLSVSFDMAF